MLRLIHDFLHRFFLGKVRFQKFFEWLYMIAIEGMNMNSTSKFHQSGEANLLKTLCKTLPKNAVIFDVGANVGNWTKEILKYNTYQIYCFEPYKPTYDKLKKNLRGYANIHFHNLALGSPGQIDLNLSFDLNLNGKCQFYQCNEDPGCNTIYQRKTDIVKFYETAPVSMTTLSWFSKEKKIKWIDFLKLDVEGNEYNVLLDAPLGEIGKIQFEIGAVNPDSGIFFKGIWDLLIPQYRIFRICKDGLYPIEKYSESLEVFYTTNYLAVLND